jgi:hypothetical protein
MGAVLMFECASCEITLHPGEQVGTRMGEGFLCSDPACPIMRAALDALALREHLDAVGRSQTNFEVHEPLTFTHRVNTPPSGPKP